MGFGWFGLSTFWLLALCWPGVRGLLGGEIRIFGPGTLRMLLGIPLAIGSSATLAALTGGEGNTAGGSVGQSLSHGLHVALGGTLAMGVASFVLLFSLPLVFGTTWWGMFARGKSSDDDIEAPGYESRFDGAAREPARGLSHMSFDTSERGERGERFTPTLGQGHHDVGSLREDPVPRRRGLAAQPRWKLSDEERARLDAMRPPPLRVPGAPRTEPSFANGARLRPTGKGASVGRAGTAVAATVASAATTRASGASLSAASVRTATSVASTAPSSVAAPLTATKAGMPAKPPMPADPLNSTSISGATGYRRPVGVAPAHLRGTIVHSPFRKPQLGLEEMPPRGAPPVPSSPADAGMPAIVDTSANVAASGAVAPRPAAPAMRGAASWSATDAASPLCAAVSAFSPVDLSAKDVDAPVFEALPPAPTSEVLAQQAAARAAEQARVQALAVLRDEAQALLRDLRQWTASDTAQATDAPALASAYPATTVDRRESVAVDEERLSMEVANVIEPVAIAKAMPVSAASDPSPPAAGRVDMTAAAPFAPDSPSAPAASTPHRPFVFADVLASVEAFDVPKDVPIDVPFDVSHNATRDEPGYRAEDAASVDVPDALEAEALASKPHYVLRADGTWARAEASPHPGHPAYAPLTHDDAISSSTPTMPSPAAAVPAIPAFAASPPFGMATTAEPRAASFSGNTPYELAPPRVVIDYDLPSLDLLSPVTSLDVANVVSDEALAAVSQLIEQRLAEFKVPVTVVGASAGPVITRFEVEPAVGVRGAQVVGLVRDLARALGVTSIRVVETIPGKTCMGLELPNAQRQMIRLSEILTAPVFDTHRSHLALAMGKDITGEPVVADLARAPHLLVAGTTGSGKSVAVNAMILSLLYKATPDDVRLIMIDPKMLELSVYGGIPHLLAPVVTDMKQAAHALNWCVGEMEKRYRLMSALGVRNLAGYNEKIDAARAAGDKVRNPFSLTPDAPEPLDRLPFIVVVIDELADLMMVAGKKIEELIARLAQKARAAGIHLILATQRPSVDVITGLIKANIPTRVAFQVSSKIDSRTILDQMGAESLLGQGDMLFLPPGTGYPQRVHGAFVADDEVHRVVQHWQQYGEPDYDEAILAGDPSEAASADLFGESSGDAEADPLYDDAAAFVLNSRRASISAVQRQLRIGYNRAARLIEQMETAGLVSPMGRNGAREVIAPGE
ncbi:DNA translocase FtsK [Pandoraea sp. XJJ-1]|uniref:DNA translocase FtsK n=1 Tax=Pandoraea sp. XJJ-1 TaxID=3002643 RepID=UPI0022800942|nr:DNA translocase FtsK [Pandoraea sp. XJJ-1]WAL84830.1 DNA translocase FtsK [Pandoraea sp. XJJ-1]